MQKRVLVVSHDSVLRDSRSALLLHAGYAVSAVGNDEDALALLAKNTFDVVLIGRNSHWREQALDERVRALYPGQVIVKIAQAWEPASVFCSRITDSVPANVLTAVQEALLGGVPRWADGAGAAALNEN